jgi:uncharacterized protein YneF (UPF0154 family)
MDLQTILILMLIAFIMGLIIGVVLARPNYPTRF